MTIAMDLASLVERDRLKKIADAVRTGKTVGVILERDQPEKIQRYTQEVRRLCPGARVIMIIENFPVLGVNTLKFARLV